MVQILGLTSSFPSPQMFPCDKILREKYCDNIGNSSYDADACKRCAVGPTCPVSGSRMTPSTLEGTLLLRGLKHEKEAQNELIEKLDEKRIEGAFTMCVPLFEWDQDLAEIAQAWADQCALVEYEEKDSPKTPKSLKHDLSTQRSIGERFSSAGSIAQTVHWARTSSLDINSEVIEALLASDLQSEDGLIDGLFASFHDDEDDDNVIAWGHATHVGCGWIQFPSSKKDNNGTVEFENFMVCNYAVGTATKTTCDEETKDQPTFITYYHATSEVIEDVKKCLAAVRCRRQLQGQNCNQDVERCLQAKSGLRFLDPSHLKTVARSDDSPIDVEASKCKIDSILCSINASFACKERVRRCLPLLDLVGDGSNNVRPLSECECADIILADGSRGSDCSEEDEDGDRFCYVKRSPCVTVDNEGSVEVSRPIKKLNDLIHKSYQLCRNKV